MTRPLKFKPYLPINGTQPNNMYELKQYSADELPNSSEAISTGLQFASRIESEWSLGRRFNGVQTYTFWDSLNQYWAARISRHTEFKYSQLLETVMKNHTENESEYIPMIDHYELLEPTKGYISRRVHYNFPFPLENRDMDIWLTSKETIPGTQFINVSIPRKLESHFIKGAYLSVEIITQMEDGHIEWVLATTSDAGGWLPQFIQRPQLAKAIAKDIPDYREWLKAKESRS